MKGRGALAVVGLALAFLAGALPVAAIEPHENPDTAPWVFDGVSLLGKYSEALDQVLGRDAVGVESLHEQAAWANIPAELRETVDGFLSSSQSLAQLIPGIEADLGSARIMLAQFRPGEAKQSLAAAAEKLSQAYSGLRAMERGAENTGRWWQVDLAGEGSALRQAYGEVEAKLLRLRRLLDLLSEVQGSLTQQEELKGGLLRPTTITLWVHPSSAFVGDSIEFIIALSAEGRPLRSRPVTLLLDGAPFAVVEVGQQGIYHGKLALPYWYKPILSLQALYYPQGRDVGFYLGSSSESVSIEVLFYKTSLSIAVQEPAYPGRRVLPRGEFNYGEAPIPYSRKLQMYWDGELAAETVVSESFTLELHISEEAALGKHQIAIYIPAQERYAPAWATAEVEVIKAAPLITVYGPGIVLLPFGRDVQGQVYSALGPLQHASLNIELGDWAVATTTRADGTYFAHLSTGMSLDLVGPQRLQVGVVPREPWSQPGSTELRLVVINLANIAGLGLALILSFVFSAHRLRRRGAAPAVATPAPQPGPVLVREESPPPKFRIPEAQARGEPRTILLALYRVVLRLVQGLTRLALRPSHTLREFAQECAPRLGPLAGYFQEFTLMMERLLYSRHHPDEGDAARARELSRRLREGAEGEDT